MERTPRNRGKHPWIGGIPPPRLEQVSAAAGPSRGSLAAFPGTSRGFFLPVPRGGFAGSHLVPIAPAALPFASSIKAGVGG